MKKFLLVFSVILLNLILSVDCFAQKKHKIWPKMETIGYRQVEVKACNENYLGELLLAPSSETSKISTYSVHQIFDPIIRVPGIGGDPTDRHYNGGNYSIHSTNYNVYTREEIRRMGSFTFK